jgi:hypothetical protein
LALQLANNFVCSARLASTVRRLPLLVGASIALRRRRAVNRTERRPKTISVRYYGVNATGVRKGPKAVASVGIFPPLGYGAWGGRGKQTQRGKTTGPNAAIGRSERRRIPGVRCANSCRQISKSNLSEPECDRRRHPLKSSRSQVTPASLLQFHEPHDPGFDDLRLRDDRDIFRLSSCHIFASIPTCSKGDVLGD